MKRKLYACITAWIMLLSLVGTVGANTITPSSSFTARLIYGENVLVGSSGQVDEGTAWNSSYLSVKEGTSDRVALEYYIGDQEQTSTATLNFSMSNMDDPSFSNLSLYAYIANGLANASDYFNSDIYITTFSDYGQPGTVSYSLDVTSVFTDFIFNGDEHLGLLLKADDINARYNVYSPTLDVVAVSVPAPGDLALFGTGLVGLAVSWIRRKNRNPSMIFT
jgi:hypothetical protein